MPGVVHRPIEDCKGMCLLAGPPNDTWKSIAVAASAEEIIRHDGIPTNGPPPAVFLLTYTRRLAPHRDQRQSGTVTLPACRWRQQHDEK